MEKVKKIFVTGHNGMVGRAILNEFDDSKKYNLITVPKAKLDLRNQQHVLDFFQKNKIDVVINAAAKVGGILANSTYPYDFIMDNMQIQNNLIDAAIQNGVDKFIFIGSSCIYPKFAPQPIQEEYLLTDSLEPTNQWYAIAKISGILACQAAKIQHGLNTVCLMPTNLYGENDNFDLKTSHVLPALIRKFHEAKEIELKTGKSAPVELWGSGTPRREFLHVRDLASVIKFALENELTEDIYNVGYGADIPIKELAQIIQKIVGHKGQIKWDSTKPDGTPKKLLDSSKLRNLGWKPTIDLEEGIKQTYNWYTAQYYKK